MSTAARGSGGVERIELTAVSGIRFFATAFMVMGRAIENLWIDSGEDAKFVSTTICSGLHTGAKDMVSFYFMLSGFTMTWGYLNREFGNDEVRWRYWVRRFARFYPDFALSSVLCYFAKQPYFFGCHDYGWWSFASNAASLLMLSAWYRIVPGTGYRNGPVWFIVTLFWLWIFFPYLLAPVKSVFKRSNWHQFVQKFLLLWVISLIPWTFITPENISWIRTPPPPAPIASSPLDLPVTKHDSAVALDHNPTHQLPPAGWPLRCFPPLRLPEFVMGMALALRVSQDRREQLEEGEKGRDAAPAPRHLANYLPIVGTVICSSHYLYKVFTWPDDCSCLPSDFFHCFGWFDVFDTKFSLVHAAMIYSVTTLDVNAALPGGGVSAASVAENVGALGAWIWSFLTWAPFVTVGKWGLPIFLYQATVNTVWQAFLADVGWGIADRCERTPFSLEYAYFYWISHVLVAYLVAWLMDENGPVGQHIHSWVKSITPK